ncbi:MAG: hypothetical protein ACI9UA_000887 [Pseudoalteromonas tetraodonis]|jgi:hypothetical protein
MKILIFFLLSAAAVFADEFSEDFEKVKVGEAPDKVMEIEGTFTVVEEDGKKFLRVGIEPLAENGMVMGPSMKGAGTIEAKIRSFKKRRSYPRFGVGLHGISGYRLRVVPSGGAVELLKNEEVVASEKFKWKADVWTNLKMEIKQDGDAWSIKGWVWPVAEGEEGKQPEKPSVSHSDKEAPGQGKGSLWGSPYSGKPVDFDDVKVKTGE